VKVGDEVLVQGQPGIIQEIKTIGQMVLALVMVLVPQVRWFPASQVQSGAPPSPATPSSPSPAPAPSANP